MKGDFRPSFAVASPTEENSRPLDPFFPPLTWNLFGGRANAGCCPLQRGVGGTSKQFGMLAQKEPDPFNHDPGSLAVGNFVPLAVSS
jgi:hypothetical protein